MSGETQKLMINLHVKFLHRFLKHAPKSFTSFEPIRPTILFFIVSSLDMLNAIDSITPEEKSAICDWIYQLQTNLNDGENDDGDNVSKCGFHGSHTLIFQDCDKYNLSEYNAGQLGMTYSCLCALVILGDDLSRVNKPAILKALRSLQNENGSFLSSIVCGDNDMRFVYCAAAICYMLNDFSYIDVSKCVDFIINSIHYDGAIGQEPGLESHGGSSFCGIAALYLLGHLKKTLTDSQMKLLQRWLIFRQQSGFQGRPNKEIDSCYSFWVGAALKLIDSFTLVNWKENRKSIMNCQNRYRGGFSKYHYTEVDPMHTYFAICGLSLMEEPGLQEMHPALNMSIRAFTHLSQLHQTWST